MHIHSEGHDDFTLVPTCAAKGKQEGEKQQLSIKDKCGRGKLIM